MFRWLKSVFLIFGMVLAGMFGGQKEKSVRRYGIPILAIAGNFSRKSLPFLLFLPILSLGYGESSWIALYFASDGLRRAVYAFMLGIPFIFFGIKRWGIAVLFLTIAFQIRAGSLGHVGWFGDLLIEDIVRYGILGVLVVFNLTFPVKK